MFVETVTYQQEEWLRWEERIGMYADPPGTLAAAVAWQSGPDEITSVHVWDAPGDIADFFLERLQDVFAEHGPAPASPERHGPPIKLHIRGLA